MPRWRHKRLTVSFDISEYLSELSLLPCTCSCCSNTLKGRQGALRRELCLRDCDSLPLFSQAVKKIGRKNERNLWTFQSLLNKYLLPPLANL